MPTPITPGLRIATPSPKVQTLLETWQALDSSKMLTDLIASEPTPVELTLTVIHPTIKTPLRVILQASSYTAFGAILATNHNDLLKSVDDQIQNLYGDPTP